MKCLECEKELLKGSEDFFNNLCEDCFVEKRLVKQTLWNLKRGGYFGLLIPTETMKKIVKLHHEFVCKVKDILLEDKEKLFCNEWAGVRISKEKIVTFDELNLGRASKDSDEILERIENNFLMPVLEKKERVVFCNREESDKIMLVKNGLLKEVEE